MELYESIKQLEMKRGRSQIKLIRSIILGMLVHLLYCLSA